MIEELKIFQQKKVIWNIKKLNLSADLFIYLFILKWREKLWHSVHHSLQYSNSSLLVNALSYVGKRLQKIIK